MMPPSYAVGILKQLSRGALLWRLPGVTPSSSGQQNSSVKSHSPRLLQVMGTSHTVLMVPTQKPGSASDRDAPRASTLPDLTQKGAPSSEVPLWKQKTNLQTQCPGSRRGGNLNSRDATVHPGWESTRQMCWLLY